MSALTFGASGGGTIELSNNRVTENAPSGEIIGLLSMAEGGTWAYSLPSGYDAAGRVSIVNQQLLTTSTAFDYETATAHTIRIRAVRAVPFADITREVELVVLNVADGAALGALTLSTTTFDSTVAVGGVLATISGKSAGSAVSTTDARFAINGDGTQLLRGLGAWANGPATVPLVETLAGSPNSPRTTNIDGTIQTGVTYDYLITNDGSAGTPGSFLNIMALGPATLAGKTIGVQPLPGGAAYSKKSFGTGQLLPGGTLGQTITFKATSKPCRIDRLSFNTGNVSMIWDGFDLLSYQTPMVDSVVYNETWAGDLTFNGNYMSGNYRGDPYFPLDVLKEDYKEYAHVRAIVSGGVVTGGTVMRAYIGDNWTGAKTDPLNGTITFNIVNTVNVTKTGTGTNASGTINVVNGFLDQASINITAGGTLYSSTSTSLETIFDIPGRITMKGLLDYIYRDGVNTQAGNGRVYWLDNYMTLASNGIKSKRPGHTIIGNTIDAMHGDCIGINGGTGGVETVIKFNFLTRPVARGDDYGQPHCDGIQFGNQGTMLVSDHLLWIEGNVISNGVTRANFQSMLISDVPAPPSTVAYSGRICNNIAMNATVPIMMQISRARDLLIYGNTFGRYDPTDPVNAGTTGQVAIVSAAYGSVYVGENIYEFSAGFPPTARLENNAIVTPRSSADYQAKFANPLSHPTTLAECIAAWTSIGAVADKGAVRTGNPVDWVNRTVNVSGERVYAKFATYLDAPLSTPVTSAWTRIIGGPDTGSYSVSGSGFTVEFADDRQGTNTVAGGTAGTYTRGKYIRAKMTTGAANNTTEAASITLGGFTYTWSVITTSVLSYSSIDNQATAWSLLAAPGLGTATNHNMLVFSMEARADVITTGRVFLGRTTSNDQVSVVTPGVFQLALSTGGVTAKTEMTLTANTWYRIIVLIDTTLQRVEIIVNDGKATLATAAATLNGSMNLNTLFNSAPGLGLFAANAGGVMIDGQMRFLYWHSWNKASRPNLAIPPANTEEDVTNWYSRFSPDFIGANGNGVLTDTVLGPEQPLGLWKFAPALANDPGGQPNLGSVANRPWIKQAGLYV